MSLWNEFLTNTGPAIHKWKHYFPAYERHLERYRNRPCTIVEIGCGQGGSSQLWRRWLGPLAQVVGLDIRPECSAFATEEVAIRIGDQSDTNFLASVLEEFGTPDIVVDDGSHVMEHVNTTFRYLYPRTAKDAVYIIEDMHTAYWPSFGGGLKREGSFIETAKDLVDELNADLSRGAVAPTDFTRTTLSMHFYDSMVVFERGRTPPKSAPLIPGKKG